MIKKFDEFKEIQSLLEAEEIDEGLELSLVSATTTSVTLDINGTLYKYLAPDGEIIRKFQKMLTFSKGKALAWLKKNVTKTEKIEK